MRKSFLSVEFEQRLQGVNEVTQAIGETELVDSPESLLAICMGLLLLVYTVLRTSSRTKRSVQQPSDRSANSSASALNSAVSIIGCPSRASRRPRTGMCEAKLSSRSETSSSASLSATMIDDNRTWVFEIQTL
ncbi:hypothetical protein CPC08DRAFT_252249 [Agrocybe pediades]|nr:hypothetical protein CPC08DRAFT_252249 [Agrocybe pediades]